MFSNDCFSPLLEMATLRSGSEAITDFSRAASEKMDRSKTKTNISLFPALPVERCLTL